MTHNRECPKCGKIVPWTRGKPEMKTMPNGSKARCTPMYLICPEHGEFEPRAHEQLRRDLARVSKELSA